MQTDRRAASDHPDSDSMMSVRFSLSDSDGCEQRNKIRTNAGLARVIRHAADGSGRFDDFTNHDYAMAVGIFARSGYYRIENIRKIRGNSMAFSIQKLRKGTGENGPLTTRLVLDISEIFQT